MEIKANLMLFKSFVNRHMNGKSTCTLCARTADIGVRAYNIFSL